MTDATDTDEWLDLTRPFDADAEHSLALEDPRIETISDVEADGANVQRVTFPTHGGTHVDAPRHVLPGGSTVDETPLSRLVTEGVVLGVDAEEARQVDVADLRGLEELRDGDAALFAFGWTEHTGTDRYHRYPWLSVDLADRLVEREVALVGMDTLSPDEPRELRGGGDPYPVHRRLLGSGVPVVENLADPSELVGERVEVLCLPLQLRGGDGAPARVLARRFGD
ncbi:MAG: cyclase family protein [Haloarculaceae archaeon]